MHGNGIETSSDRRRFLRLLALAGVSSALAGPRLAMAQTKTVRPGRAPAKPKKAPARRAAAAPPDTTAKAPPPIQPSEDALALAAIVKRRYGAYLDETQLAKVAVELEQRIQSGRRLRDIKLANGEEPDFVFRA